MPRIYASNNDPIDYCCSCWPSEDLAREIHGNCGVGPDGRGDCFDYASEHPPYEYEDYECESCGRRLTYLDN